jgi:hypothetical protein
MTFDGDGGTTQIWTLNEHERQQTLSSSWHQWLETVWVKKKQYKCDVIQCISHHQKGCNVLMGGPKVARRLIKQLILMSTPISYR